MIGIDDLPPRPPPDRGPIIRNRKRRPLHPEEIHRRLRERAEGKIASRGPTPFGWLVILYPETGRVVRETRENATYEEAVALYERERSWIGPCDGWIVAKQRPDQRTVRP